MTGYFLSPHSDDEAMFGAYTLLRHKPTVVQVLRCDLRRAPWQVRAAEAVAGAAVLGCDNVVQLDVLESDPGAAAILDRLARLPDPGRVWAPAPHNGGHPHHNLVGACALIVFPAATLYSTYALNPRSGENEKTIGTAVPPEPGWPDLKRAALACYVSQHHNSSFQWPLDEYIA